eukprot:3770229-Amphidinium_carterae.1
MRSTLFDLTKPLSQPRSYQWTTCDRGSPAQTRAKKNMAKGDFCFHGKLPLHPLLSDYLPIDAVLG